MTTTTKTTMRAWRSNALGLGGLALEEIACPQAGPHELLIRVEAAALNFADTLMLEDRYQVKPSRPFTMGQEVAGTVIEAGAETSFAVGDRIAGKVVTGGFADYARVRADLAMRVPQDFPIESAAALPIAYTTALVALTESTTIEPGDTVLVTAAAGGSGLAAVEVARSLGAIVIAAAGGADKCALTEAHGADVTIDYKSENVRDRVKDITKGRGVDVIVDLVGGDARDLLRMLAWGGRLLISGFTSGEIPQIPANRLLLRRLSAIGVYWDADQDRDMIARVFGRLADLTATGQLAPHIGATFAFEDLPKALTALRDRATTGKVILSIGA